MGLMGPHPPEAQQECPCKAEVESHPAKPPPQASSHLACNKGDTRYFQRGRHQQLLPHSHSEAPSWEQQASISRQERLEPATFSLHTKACMHAHTCKHSPTHSYRHIHTHTNTCARAHTHTPGFINSYFHRSQFFPRSIKNLSKTENRCCSFLPS